LNVLTCFHYPAQLRKEPAHLIEPTDALKFETFHIFQNNVQVRVRADGVNVLHDVLVLPQILIDFGHPAALVARPLCQSCEGRDWRSPSVVNADA